MAQINFTIPDAILPEVVDSFAARFGYIATLPNGDPNPQTKGQFCKEQIRNYIRAVVRDHKMQEAQNAANASIEAAQVAANATTASIT